MFPAAFSFVALLLGSCEGLRASVDFFTKVPDPKECGPFETFDNNTMEIKEEYAKWKVDALRVYRSSALGSYHLRTHHFIIVHATAADPASGTQTANFVFEVPLRRGCFGSQNPENPLSFTVGFVRNAWGHRMIRVLQYMDPSNSPDVDGKGYHKENAHAQASHSKDLASVTELSKCHGCAQITIEEMIDLTYRIIQPRRFKELGAALVHGDVISPWNRGRKTRAKEAMQRLVEKWADPQLPAPVSFENAINCRSFAFLLKYAVDALARRRLPAEQASDAGEKAREKAFSSDEETAGEGEDGSVGEEASDTGEKALPDSDADTTDAEAAVWSPQSPLSAASAEPSP